MGNPWDFGWTQLLTINGMAMTAGIAFAGFRTFGRWKREKLEEKRIEVAIDTLALVYETRFIFDHIRSGFVFRGEYDDMPERAGDDEEKRKQRGSYYAVLKKVETQQVFFERAWKLQVVCAAVFGVEVEKTFLLLQQARRFVEVSAGALMDDPAPWNQTEDNLKVWRELHDDVWEAQAGLPGHNNRIGRMLDEFREKLERLCRPIIDKSFKPPITRF
jgi:hypothetical protein